MKPVKLTDTNEHVVDWISNHEHLYEWAMSNTDRCTSVWRRELADDVGDCGGYINPAKVDWWAVHGWFAEAWATESKGEPVQLTGDQPDESAGERVRLGDFMSMDRYDGMLNCLPPRTHTAAGFQVGEPFDHVASGARYSTFAKYDDDRCVFLGVRLAGDIPGYVEA